MWLSWLGAVAKGQAERASFLRQRFSPPLSVAQDDWLGSVQRNDQGIPTSVPSGTPMDLPSYVVPEPVSADELAASAEASLAVADRASSNSTRFVLLAVIFALALFFASVATKFSEPRLQVLLIVTSLVLLAFALVKMILLPQLI